MGAAYARRLDPLDRQQERLPESLERHCGPSMRSPASLRSHWTILILCITVMQRRLEFGPQSICGKALGGETAQFSVDNLGHLVVRAVSRLEGDQLCLGTCPDDLGCPLRRVVQRIQDSLEHHHLAPVEIVDQVVQWPRAREKKHGPEHAQCLGVLARPPDLLSEPLIGVVRPGRVESLELILDVAFEEGEQQGADGVHHHDRRGAVGDSPRDLSRIVWAETPRQSVLPS